MDHITRQQVVNNRRLYRRLVSLFCTSLLLVTFVTACASGTARDANRAETEEANRPEIVSQIQATTIIQRFFPGTATPDPTSTPIVTLDSLAVSSSPGSNNQSQNSSTSLSRSGTIYATAHLYQLLPGEQIVAVWGTIDGTEYARSTVTIESNASDQWISLPWNINNAVAPGQYAVFLYVNDHLLNSLVFQLY